MLILRAAIAEDAAVLAAIDAGSPGGGWRLASFESELRLPWSRTIVAADGDAADAVVAGFAVYWLVPGEVQLLNLGVRAERRRAGIGRLLLAHVFGAGRAAGAARLVLEVRRDNEAARFLYRSLGLVEVGIRPGYYERGEVDAVLMEATLPPAGLTPG